MTKNLFRQTKKNFFLRKYSHSHVLIPLSMALIYILIAHSHHNLILMTDSLSLILFYFWDLISSFFFFAHFSMILHLHFYFFIFFSFQIYKTHAWQNFCELSSLKDIIFIPSLLFPSYLILFSFISPRQETHFIYNGKHWIDTTLSFLCW